MEIFNDFCFCEGEEINVDHMIIGLSKTIYWEKKFELMPILGDALEDAGNSQEVIVHCKGQQHFRGCGLLDKILGLI